MLKSYFEYKLIFHWVLYLEKNLIKYIRLSQSVVNFKFDPSQVQDDDEMEDDPRGHKSRSKSASIESRKPSQVGGATTKVGGAAERVGKEKEGANGEQRNDFEDTELDSDVEYEGGSDNYVFKIMNIIKYDECLIYFGHRV